MRSFLRTGSRCTISIITLGCLLLTTACSALGGKREPTPTPLPASSISANPTYIVQRGEIVKELKAKGRIVPVTEQRLFFRSSGFVREVYVHRNEAVKTGQILADLEIGDLENQLAQAKINLETAQINLETEQQMINDALKEAESALTVEKLRLEAANFNFESDGRRPQQIAVLIQEEAVKMAELRLEKLQRGVDARQVQAVDIARLTSERLQAQIDDSSIVAPFDGQVLELNISRGDDVSAFNQTVMTLYNPTQIEVSVELVSEQLKQMTEGMTVSIRKGSQTNETWEGIVRRLPSPYGSGSTGKGDEIDSSARITIQALNKLELGDLVNVEVVLEKKAGVLWLPPTAIRNFEGRKFVVIQYGDRQQRQNVVLGIQSEERVEIVEGLEEGQTIVSP